MKIKIIALAITLAIFTAGCERGERDNSRYYPMNALDIAANYSIDNIADDVSYIAQAESNAVSTAGRGGQPSFLSGCAEVTTTISANTWTRVIDFGTVNCALANGNRVRGKITLDFSDDFSANIRIVKYRFDNFYHNDRLVQGNSTVGRTIANGHPMATMNLSFTVTTPAGGVYKRVGQRIREFTSGYNTSELSDNQFAVTGSWITAFANTPQTVHISVIDTPLVIHWDCEHILSGNIKFIRDNSSATGFLDYGNGACDNNATLYINGNPFNITI